MHGSQNINVKILDESDNEYTRIASRRLTSVPPSQSPVTTTIDADYFTLEQVKKLSKAVDGPRKFLSKATFEKTLPENFFEFQLWESSDGPIYNVGNIGTRQYDYKIFVGFYIVLKDETDELPVLVWKDDIVRNASSTI